MVSTDQPVSYKKKVSLISLNYFLGHKLPLDSEIVYQCTSYGNLSKEYLNKFVDTLTGIVDDNGQSLPETTERPTLKLIYPTQELGDKIMEKNSKNIGLIFLRHEDFLPKNE